MATASRVLWKGAINFGLVHIPVRVHPATRAGGVDFDWLDRRTLDPVDYKRVDGGLKGLIGKRCDSSHLARRRLGAGVASGWPFSTT